MHRHNKPVGASLLLKGAAVLFGGLGLAICVWLVDKAIRYPHIQASQFGHVAPLWVPMLVFVLACTIAVVFLFLRAARRASAGERFMHADHYRTRRQAG